MAPSLSRSTGRLSDEKVQGEQKTAFPPLPPTAVTKRKFGTVLSNVDGVERVPGVGKRRAPGSDKEDANKSRYYHQCQYRLRFGVQSSLDAVDAQNELVEAVELDDGDKENVDPALGAVRPAQLTRGGDSTKEEAAWSRYVPLKGKEATVDGSVWTTTIEELMGIVNKLPSWKYRARASEGGPLKRFYSLPVFAIPSDSPQASEFIVDWSSPMKIDGGRKPSAAVDYRKAFSLSAQSPSFVPQDSLACKDPTNEMLQMASTPAKKVAPHMDWWPGDWKCKKCGNHVQRC